MTTEQELNFAMRVEALHYNNTEHFYTQAKHLEALGFQDNANSYALAANKARKAHLRICYDCGKLLGSYFKSIFNS